ncbi:MAG: choice-of-anchor E domain-containing protein [Stellaceae bacterium]
MRQCTLIRSFGFILAVVGTITSFGAQADTITQTDAATEGPIYNTGINLSFNKFDPSLGNLTDVGLSLSGDASFSVDFTPVYCVDDPDFGPYNCSYVIAEFYFGFYFLGPGLPPNPNAPFMNPNDEFDYGLDGNVPQTVGPVTINAGAPINSLTGYIGTGNVVIDYLTGVDLSQCYDIGRPGNSVFCSDDASLILSLTYGYTPVLEPNTILLLITSMGLMGMVSLFASSRMLSHLIDQR